MAVAQPYVPGIRVPIPSGRKATLAVKDYFRGTSAPSWLAFGALAAMFLVAIFAPLLAPFDPLVPAGKAMAAPSAENWLGTDTVGLALIPIRRRRRTTLCRSRWSPYH